MDELTSRASQLLDELHEIMAEMAQKLRVLAGEKDTP